MNAPQFLPPREPRRSRSPRRFRSPRRSRERVKRQAWGTVWETGLKLSVELAIAAGAVVTLARLVPSYRTSQVELQKLDAEVETTRARVGELQQEFSRYFDPTLTQTFVQEQTPHADPTRRPVVWLGEDRATNP